MNYLWCYCMSLTRSHICFLFIAILLGSSSFEALAAPGPGCTGSGTDFEQYPEFSPGAQIVYKPSDPAGTVIARVSGSINVSIKCGATAKIYKSFTANSTQVTSFANVYQTTNIGIGIRIYDSALGKYITPDSTLLLQTYSANTVFGSTTLTVEWVKLAGPNEPMETGSMRSTMVSMAYQPTNTTANYPISSPTFGRATKLIPQVCTLTTTSLNYEMGTLNASEFGSAVGFNPAKTATQNLGLSCVAGTNVYATLSATQHPDVADTSVFALSGQGSTGTASGVGMQLMYNGQPLKIGESLLLKSTAGASESLPLTARYYQTKPVVMPGEANALAVLNITYQ